MFVNNQEEVIRQIEQHADESLPNEICGFVLRNPSGFQYRRLTNLAEDPKSAFVIDPAIFAINYGRIEYVVHSHVNKTPYPSEKDVVMCDRTLKPFLIISVPTKELYTVFPKNWGHKDYLERDFFYGANDCFTAIRDFYKAELNIELHDPVRLPYGWWDSSDEDLSTVTIREAQRHGFEVVDTPRHGDVIILSVGATQSHWGVYLSDNRILQNTLNTKTRIETYGDFWRKKTVCFMRHHERNRTDR